MVNFPEFCKDCEGRGITRFAKWYVPIKVYNPVSVGNRQPVCEECLNDKNKTRQNLKRPITFGIPSSKG